MVAAGQQIPTVGSLFDFRALRLIQDLGLYQATEAAWREQGDLFALQIFNRKLIFAIHPDYVQHISLTQRKRYSKEASYENPRRFLFGNGLVGNRGASWLRQRRLMAPFFTPRAIEDFVEVMVQDTVKLAEEWAQAARNGRIVDVEGDMNKLAASIILHSMFSVEAEDEMLGIKEAIETMIAYTSMRLQSPLTPPLWVPVEVNRRYNAARERVQRYVQKLIAERQQLPEAAYPDDLLSKLLLTEDDETGERMPPQQVYDEAVTIFMAGHETTARTMALVWYVLSQEPEALHTMHAEIDRVVQGDVPTLAELKQLGYTLRVIKETMRLYPIAIFYVRDAVEDDVIAGHAIPAGTGIMLAPYLTHRHPDFWDDPMRFDPMRFAPTTEKMHHPFQYHPFAGGQRICIGNHFSLLEAQIILSVLAKRFDLSLVEGYDFQLTGLGTLGLANGLPMHIHPR